MNSVGTKRHILGFMYGERLKASLIVASQLLDVLADLNERERPGGLKVFGSFVRGVGSEMRLAANAMGAEGWKDLSAQLNLMEGYARLGQMEAARHELSRTLSRITTLSGVALASLEKAGLL